MQAWLGAPSCRISPLLNAVDIDQYPMNTNPAPPRPTTVMLSHVYPLKDILTAIKAASVIVKTYHVEGSPSPPSLIPHLSPALWCRIIRPQGMCACRPSKPDS